MGRVLVGYQPKGNGKVPRPNPPGVSPLEKRGASMIIKFSKEQLQEIKTLYSEYSKLAEENSFIPVDIERALVTSFLLYLVNLKSDLIQETVTVGKERLEQLINAEEFLNCLEACGVDNWNGYSDACEMMEEE